MAVGGNFQVRGMSVNSINNSVQRPQQKGDIRALLKLYRDYDAKSAKFEPSRENEQKEIPLFTFGFFTRSNDPSFASALFIRWPPKPLVLSGQKLIVE